MDDWKEHVKLEITDASTDVFRLLQIQVAISDMKEVDLIPNTVHTELSTLIQTVNDASNQGDSSQ
jgi:hypothetical protein